MITIIYDEELLSAANLIAALEADNRGGIEGDKWKRVQHILGREFVRNAITTLEYIDLSNRLRGLREH